MSRLRTDSHLHLQWWPCLEKHEHISTSCRFWAHFLVISVEAAFCAYQLQESQTETRPMCAQGWGFWIPLCKAVRPDRCAHWRVNNESSCHTEFTSLSLLGAWVWVQLPHNGNNEFQSSQLSSFHIHQKNSNFIIVNWSLIWSVY